MTQQDNWKLMYWDAFDREMPPQVEAQGQGLQGGLVELWSHFLAETVQENGSEGFSRFYLTWDRPTIYIGQVTPGAVRLRRWVFDRRGNAHTAHENSRDEALLLLVAGAHMALLEEKDPAGRILVTAGVAADRADFEKRLRGALAGH